MGNSRCIPSVVFFVLLFLCSQSLPIVALDRGEKAALTDMQAEWGTQLGWTGSPKCSWLGVECIFGHVHGLYELSFTFFFQLEDPWRSLIVNLKSFRLLSDLEGSFLTSQLTGTIPESIGQLTHLRVLFVSSLL